MQRAGGSSTANRVRNEHERKEHKRHASSLSVAEGRQFKHQRQHSSGSTRATASEDENAEVLQSILGILTDIHKDDAAHGHSPRSGQELTAAGTAEMGRYVEILRGMTKASAPTCDVPDAADETAAALGMLALQGRPEAELTAAYELLFMSLRQDWSRLGEKEHAPLERLVQELFDKILKNLDAEDIKALGATSTTLRRRLGSSHMAYAFCARMRPIDLARGQLSLIKLDALMRKMPPVDPRFEPLLQVDRDTVRLAAVAKVMQLPTLVYGPAPVVPGQVIRQVFPFFAKIVHATESDAARVDGMTMLTTALCNTRLTPADAAQMFFPMFRGLCAIAKQVKSPEASAQVVSALVGFFNNRIVSQPQSSRFQCLDLLADLIGNMKNEASAAKAISMLPSINPTVFHGPLSSGDRALASTAFSKIRAKAYSFADRDRAFASDIALRAAFLTRTHTGAALVEGFDALLAEGKTVVSDESKCHVAIALQHLLRTFPEDLFEGLPEGLSAGGMASKVGDILDIVKGIKDPKLKDEACQFDDCVRVLQEGEDRFNAIDDFVNLAGEVPGKASNRLVAQIGEEFTSAFNEVPDGMDETAEQRGTEAHGRLVAMADFKTHAEDRKDMVLSLLRALDHVSVEYQRDAFVNLLNEADNFDDDEKAYLLQELCDYALENKPLYRLDNEIAVVNRLIQFVAGINGEIQKVQGISAIAEMQSAFDTNGRRDHIAEGLDAVVAQMPDSEVKRMIIEALQQHADASSSPLPVPSVPSSTPTPSLPSSLDDLSD